jgi:hypothetical protein
MLSQTLKRQILSTQSHFRRCYIGFPSSPRAPPYSRISAAGGTALTASLMLGLGYSLYADAPSSSGERPRPPLSKLITSYVVYSMCSIPGLVDASPALLAFCTSIPGLRQLTEAFVRATFFTQVRRDSSNSAASSRMLFYSLLAVTPHVHAYRWSASFVQRTKVLCLRIAWRPMRAKRPV